MEFTMYALKDYLKDSIKRYEDAINRFHNSTYAENVSIKYTCLDICETIEYFKFDPYWLFKYRTKFNYFHVINQFVIRSNFEDIACELTRISMNILRHCNSKSISMVLLTCDTGLKERVFMKYINEDLKKLKKRAIFEYEIGDDNSLMNELFMRYYILDDMISWCQLDDTNIRCIIDEEYRELLEEHDRIRFANQIRK